MTTEIKDLISLGSGMIMILLWLASLLSAYFGISKYLSTKRLFECTMSPTADHSDLVEEQRKCIICWIKAYILLGMSIGFLFLCLFFQGSG